MPVTLNKTTYKLKSEPKSPKKNVKISQYNDGYAQIVVSGINPDRETINPQWIPMDSTTAIALETLLLNSVDGIANILLFTPEGEDTAKYYTADDIRRDTIQTGWYQISCTLTRRFPII